MSKKIGHRTCKAIIEIGRFMVKKTVVLGLCLTGSMGTAIAEVVGDSIASEQLKEVIVVGNSARQRIGNTRLGSERLEMSKIMQVPAFGGEADIIRSITLLPGVRSERDGGGGFEVRGGNAYQNLVLLDGISLYNPAHVMGIFSTFNENALGGATLHKGPLPAMYGNATSSVLELSLIHI